MNNKNLQYPIKFNPILKEKIWGGNKLKHLFGKLSDGNIGESWEISGVEDDVSVVSNGPLKGKTLTELIDEFQELFVGEKVYKSFGNTFPLLFKFIDAHQDLSVQLHPNDELAKQRHNSFGKTEMWYILNSDEPGKLLLGFNKKMDETLYKKHLLNNSLSEILQFEKVKKGDAFLIETGTVHAIGAGVVLAEIQQTSDITYRIYDYDRPGIDGNLRELHTDLALDAINFNSNKTQLDYIEKENEPTHLCKTPYFHTNKLIVNQNLKRDLSLIDSFVVYMCVEGSGDIVINDKIESIITGETILIPAIINSVEIKTSSASFLEVYIP
ncbi:MAG: mannose-6-phosphate isomerase [Flavobacteriaceae bacterium]